MAIDANIPLVAGRPQGSFFRALTEGIEAGEKIRQAPLLRELKRQAVSRGQQQIQAGESAAQQRQISLDQQGGQFINRFAAELKALPFEQRAGAIAQNANAIRNLGLDPANLGNLDDQSLDQVIAATNPFVAQQIQAKGVQSSESLPGGITKIVTRAGQIQVKDAANNIIEGPQAIQMVQAAEERKVELAKQKAQQTAIGKGGGQRAQDVINQGLEAAKGIPTLKRTISLLDEVKTGGIAQAQLRARQLFGIEGADEGELSSNLGQAILGDLRATFGAAFTEKEGARLERIRANFGRNPKTNQRLLKQSLQIAENAVKRAIKRAVDNDDFATAAELQESLNFTFQFEDDTNAVQNQERPQAQDTQAAPQVLRFDAQGNLIQ